MSSDRPKMIAKLHIARQQLGLAETDYRQILARVTGRDSARELTPAQLDDVIAEFRRLGWRPAKRASRPHARLIYALWGDLAKAGALRDGSAAGLRAWVERQSGVAAPDFLTADQARPLIEGLKKWLARAATQPAGGPDAA